MVFEQPIQQARAQGYRELTPLGGPGRVTYLMTRSRDLTAFMDAVMRRLDELGIEWDYWSSETAPGQVEINLSPAGAVETADRVTRTKLALREVAEEEGRSVTFMAYGIDPHLGGGTHVNLSLQSGGENAFRRGDDGGHSEELRRFVAGLLATLPGAMSFFTPNVNSYRRLVEITGPPTTVTWGEDNKSVAVRTATSEPKSSRVEHRVPSGDCNIYLTIAAILAGGIVGLEDGLEPPPSSRGWPGGCRRTPRRGSPPPSPTRPPRCARTAGWPRCSAPESSSTGSAAATGSREPSAPAEERWSRSATSSCCVTSSRPRAMADERLFEELLDGANPCCLTTLRENGDPYSVVVWCGRDGDRVTVNAAESGRWLANLRRDPRASLVVVDTSNILRHVSVEGRAAEIELDEGYEHIHALSQVYLDRPYPWSGPEEEARYRVVIEPERVRTVDIPLPAE